MKFCVNCKHFLPELTLAVETPYRSGRFTARTATPACDAMSRDIVTGKHAEPVDCSTARQDNPGYCGTDARFFEARPDQRPVGSE